jgi:hypothetical protein
LFIWQLVHVNKALGLITTGISFAVIVMMMGMIMMMTTMTMMIAIVMINKLHKFLQSVE